MKEKAMEKQRGPSVRELVAGIFFVSVLGAGLVFSVQVPIDFPRDASVFSGERTAAIQDTYERRLVIRNPSVHLWTAFTYLLFREGREGLLIGEDGWLFTSEEFYPAEDEEEALLRSLDTVLAVRDELAAQEIELMVALVPSKARIYRDKLGRYRFPPYALERHSLFLANLSEHGVPAPDLVPVLAGARKEQEVFLRTDTHWTPFGAERAAAALADTGRKILEGRNSERSVFSISLLNEIQYTGDLLAFLPLGRLGRLFGPEPDTVRRAETEIVEGPILHAGLFGEVSIPVTVVGTSYSAGELWNFKGFLKKHLLADALQSSDVGRGPFAPMKEYLESDMISDYKPDLVIWEIPERYLTGTLGE